ncbi:hypothetical protein [Nocardia brasiliensis]|uniref:hypothetical protein n=1 Tax=Nocardia brasiliensis TaxID=37326 RepID=UPI002458B5F7|nr:hypothetical protein [Nocardia brasiliensis]
MIFLLRFVRTSQVLVGVGLVSAGVSMFFLLHAAIPMTGMTALAVWPSVRC